MFSKGIYHKGFIFLIDRKLTNVYIIKEPLLIINNRKINYKKIRFNMYKNKIYIYIFKQKVNNLKIDKIIYIFYLYQEALDKQLINGYITIDQISLNISIEKTILNIETHIKIKDYRQDEDLNINKNIKINLLKNYNMKSLLNLDYKVSDDSIFIKSKSKGNGSNIIEFWNKYIMLEDSINKPQISYWGLIEWKLYKTNIIGAYNELQYKTI